MVIPALIVFILAFISVEGNVSATRRLAACGERLFVEDAITIDATLQDDCVWQIETQHDRILVFTVEMGDMEIAQDIFTVHDGSNEDAPILVENQKTYNASRKGVPRAIYTTQSTAVLRLKKTSSNFQLKIQKAVDCPFNLGPGTQCGRIFDGVSCYCAVYTERDYQGQKSFCSSNDMVQVALESYSEEQAIQAVWAGVFWTSLTDLLEEDLWIWESTSTGLDPGYSNWSFGEPDDAGGEDCVIMLYLGWSDKSCDWPYGTICELNP